MRKKTKEYIPYYRIAQLKAAGEQVPTKAHFLYENTIAEALGRKHMSPSELGRKLDMDRRTVDNWCHGRTAPKNLFLLADLARTLNTSVTKLYPFLKKST